MGNGDGLPTSAAWAVDEGRPRFARWRNQVYSPLRFLIPGRRACLSLDLRRRERSQLTVGGDHAYRDLHEGEHKAAGYEEPGTRAATLGRSSSW
jgi:hypothetical protein